jgi:hypothetical protein
LIINFSIFEAILDDLSYEDRGNRRSMMRRRSMKSTMSRSSRKAGGTGGS